MYGAFDRLYELADSPHNIIPGHDPLVFQRYSAVSPDLEEYAVEIVPHEAALSGASLRAAGGPLR